MADPAWIQARADRLEAIFITHGHEDHVGALGLLWHRLQAPVYARRFTAALAKSKMERAGQPTDAVRQVGTLAARGAGRAVHASASCRSPTRSRRARRWSSTPRRGGSSTAPTSRPTRRRWSASRSTPQALARARRRRASRCWPAIRPTSSTLHPGRSEATLIEPIGAADARGRGPGGRHHLRLERRAAEDPGRGRRAPPGAQVRGARPGDEHHAQDRPRRRGARRLSADASTPLDIDTVPRRQLLVLATGSQGERRAATAQLAQGSTWASSCGAGDTFLFSSKTIPGNEVAVARILNLLSEKGVTVVDDSDGPLPRLRPRQPARPRGAAGAGAAADASCRCTASTATSRRHAALAARARHRRGGGAERHDARPDRRRAARRRADRDRPGLPRRHRADRRAGRRGARPHPHGDARPRRGQRHHRRGRPAARRRLGRGPGPARQPEDARRRSRARSRPSSAGCSPAPSAPSSTTTTRSRS